MLFFWCGLLRGFGYDCVGGWLWFKGISSVLGFDYVQNVRHVHCVQCMQQM